MDYLIAVDIGSTNIKACAFDRYARPVERRSAPCSFVAHPNPQFREQDPEAMRRAVIESVAALQGALNGRPAAIVFSSAMHSLIAVDREGRPLTRCISWADLRGATIAAALRDTDTGAALYARCGTPIHPMSPLIKITWLQQNEPKVFAATDKYVGIKEYVLHDLLGRWVVDTSIASATGLFDIHERRWDAFALAFAGIDADRLPEPVDATTVLTGLSAERAREMGVPADTPLVAGASDGCLANLGAQVFDPRSAVITLGTSAAIRSTRPAPVSDPDGRLFNYLLYGGRYVVGGPSNNAGYLLQWFSERFDGATDMERGLAAAANIEAGAGGLMCIPHLLGERAPLWDPLATGAFIGIRADHGREHFRRAILEGILFNIKAIGVHLESVAGGFDELHVNGGLSRSDTVMQMLADIFNSRARRSTTADASARGAAMVALAALGVIGEPEDLAESDGEASFEPDPDTAQRYGALFTRYDGAVAGYRTINALLSPAGIGSHGA